MRKRAAHMHRNGMVECFQGKFFQAAPLGRATGIVDQNVQPPEAFMHCMHASARMGFIGRIGLHKHRAAGLGHFLAQALPPPAEGDSGSLLDKTLDDATAYTAGAPGYESNLVLESLDHVLVFPALRMACHDWHAI